MSTYKEHLHLGDKDVLVETDDLASGAVTTPKLADGSVTAEKMESSLYERLNDHRTTTDKVTDALGRTQTQINQQLADAINNWIFAEGTPPAAKTLQAATGDEYMVVNTAEGLRYLKLSDFIKAISDEFIDALDHLDEQGGETDPLAQYDIRGEAKALLQYYWDGTYQPNGQPSNGDLVLFDYGEYPIARYNPSVAHVSQFEAFGAALEAGRTAYWVGNNLCVYRGSDGVGATPQDQNSNRFWTVRTGLQKPTS